MTEATTPEIAYWDNWRVEAALAEIGQENLPILQDGSIGGTRFPITILDSHETEAWWKDWQKKHPFRRYVRSTSRK